jgi:ABC-2 type transport system permease protein
MLWVFPGSFNILDGGYATLDKFFNLAPILFIVLIPALTMRAFAEEKRSGTFVLLFSRPVSISRIWFSKWLAIWLLTVAAILSTVIYVVSIYMLGNPQGNIGLNSAIVSYLSLILFAALFCATGLFASSLTTSQVTAFVLAALINFALFYGFDIVSGLFQSGKIKYLLASFGGAFHLGKLKRGVVEPDDIAILILYFTLSWFLSLVVLNRSRYSLKAEAYYTCLLLALCIALYALPAFRLDFTSDKRYTINSYSKKLMSEAVKNYPENICVNVYLEGKLNYGFQRLRQATEEILNDLNSYAGHKLSVSFVDPYSQNMPTGKLSEHMANADMEGIMIHETGRDGKLNSQLIFPYAQVITGNDTIAIPLLKNVAGYTAEENLNASIENLEFQFVDALRLLLNHEEQHIAFVEGHGELPRAYVYDAEEALSKYYFVDRGQITNDISVLDGFKVVIIAGPTRKFSEAEKYILDQYLMRGGRILWLLDGAYLSESDLMEKGMSPSIKNETNLDDLLFAYGVKVLPVLLQDSQCASIPVSSGNNTQPTIIPCYYYPLLLPSPEHVITKGIADIKAGFTSEISLSANAHSLDSHVLLSTALHSRKVSVPEAITLDITGIQSSPNYFDASFIPVAVSLAGCFHSPFENRPVPDSINMGQYKPLTVSKEAKMLIVASSSLIRNDITGKGEDTRILPMGFDRLVGKLYGNKDFIVNAVNWLANDGVIGLKSKSRRMDLLNRQQVYQQRNVWGAINTLFPIFSMFLLIIGVNIWRKRRYNNTKIYRKLVN